MISTDTVRRRMLARMQHTFVRLAGRGLFVLPSDAFRLERVAGSSETTLAVTAGDRHAELELLSVLRGETETDLVEVGPHPRPGAFHIETTIYTCPWPAGFALVPDDLGESAFLLVGADDAMIWIAGPMPNEKTRPIESKLVAEDQRIRAIADSGDDAYVDLDYVVDDAPYWQRRYLLAWGAESTLVVSAQAPASAEESTREAIALVADGLARFRAD